MAKAKRRRLDDELVEQGYFIDRDTAMRAVMAGEVSSGGARLTSPGALVAQGAPLHVKSSPKASRTGRGVFVGRGGIKLEGALEALGVDPTGLNCIDVGCSTGGFTDCLLKFGARRVAAVDVGYGQFDWGLRSDPRVALFERTNICGADPELLGAPFDVAVADVSFTCVANIVPSVFGLLGPGGVFCTLVKPQFEAARDEVGQGGVVRDPDVHLAVLEGAAEALRDEGFRVVGACPSQIHGAKGNIEYFLLAKKAAGAPEGCREVAREDLRAVVAQAWEPCDREVRPQGGSEQGGL